MIELVWTPEAIQDREDIYNYIELENPLAALTLDELFSDKAALLVDHPDSVRPGRTSGTRELVVHTRYMLVYEIVGKQVRMLNVVHTARHWPPEQREQSMHRASCDKKDRQPIDFHGGLTRT